MSGCSRMVPPNVNVSNVFTPIPFMTNNKFKTVDIGMVETRHLQLITSLIHEATMDECQGNFHPVGEKCSSVAPQLDPRSVKDRFKLRPSS